MDILELRTYCLSFPESEETTPFDETTLVYKVAGKMFAMTDMIHADHVALKCDPSLALDLREEYPDIDTGTPSGTTATCPRPSSGRWYATPTCWSSAACPASQENG